MSAADRSSVPTWAHGSSFTIVTPPDGAKRGIRRLEFNILLWKAAGVTISTAEPRYMVHKGMVLITTSGAPGWRGAGKKACLPREGGRRYIALSKIPKHLHNELAVIVGDGYLVLAAVDVARGLGIPEVHVPAPTFRTIRGAMEVDTAMPRLKAEHYRVFNLSDNPKLVRFLDVGGSIWDDIACASSACIKVTRYRDGFVVEKTTADDPEALSLTKKLTSSGKEYAHKRFGERLLRVINSCSVRALTSGDKLLFIDDAVKLSDFDLPDSTPPVLRKQRIL